MADNNLTFKHFLVISNVFFVLLFIKIALVILPFTIFRRFYKKIVRPSEQASSYLENEITMVAWAISVLSHRFPFLSFTCLPQSLAFKFFFRRNSTIKVHIGIKTGINDGVDAHAWVEKEGKILLGELKNIKYQPIWIWE